MTTDNRDLPGWMRPDNVVSFRKSGIDTGKGYTAIEPAFPHSSMHQFSRIDAFQTDLDFLATPFLTGIDDQRANILSYVKHDMFGVHPVNRTLDHLFAFPLLKNMQNV